MIRLFLAVVGAGVIVLAVFAASGYLVAWAVKKWCEQEQQAERRRTFDRVMKANEKPYSGQRARQYNHPSAPGLDRDRNRVS